MKGYGSFCLVCGDVTDGAMQCPEHLRARQSEKKNRRGSTKELGYDGQWVQVSNRARARQNFCTDCGKTTRLETDHLPSAWWRREHRLPIRLADVDVTCGPCNSKRGSSRPGSPRYEAWVMANA